MKISESWLREWVNPKIDSDALAHQLTMLGLEVDNVEPVAGELTDIVVGEVLNVAAHPDADRLSLCQVGVGRKTSLTIVCGAANVRAGGLYPTALVGARLPGGMEIRSAKIRGQKSEGMLCSEAELGLAESADGIMELDAGCAVGAPVTAALGLDDRVIDVDLTPNRADCFSVLGIARDLAAGQRMPFAEPEIADVPATCDEVFPVRLEKKAGCGRFAGRVIRNVDPAARTPVWVQERLRRSGVRPINPVVDVTNYVMLELGQPLHAYDLDKLTDGIRVRRGKKSGESLTLLDGQTVTVDADVLVIADGSGAIGLAGIMGGQGTAVSEATRNVFLESAFFAPDVIAGRARRFGLQSDAATRFERGVDAMHQVRAIERATGLLLEIAGGEPGPLIEETMARALPVAEPISLRRDRLQALLGQDIPDDKVEAFLTSVQMDVRSVADGWQVTAPAARFDIEIEADLVEEVARLFGYDQIREVPGNIATVLGTDTEMRVADGRIGETLAVRGYQEAMTYSFVGPDIDAAFAGDAETLALSNPISSELAVMRRTLWPGLIEALRYNLSRQHSRVRLFESGVRFLRQDTDIIEEKVLSGLAAGSAEPEQWDRPARVADLFDVKSDLEAVFGLTGAADEFEFRAGEHPALRPGRGAKILRAGESIGWTGELHPALVKKLELTETPLLFEVSMEPAFAARKAEFRGVSKFPVVRRDIAVIIGRDIAVGELEKTVRDAGGPRLREAVIFDVYEGQNIETGSKSVALGLILQVTSRTLTEADVNEVMHAVIDRLSRDFNATIRE